MLDAALKLFEEFSAHPSWTAPFPMGVFGTLRLRCGNTYLMGNSVDGKQPPPERSWWRETPQPKYQSWHKAFMPHFSPSGLSIQYDKDKAGVFEVFTYTPEEWSHMIGPVDGLEGFSPQRDNGRGGYGYYRTLAWLHILPEDFKSKFFDTDPWPGDPRTLSIPVEDWGKHQRVPCWVYSSRRQNERSVDGGLDYQPVIWYGDKITNSRIPDAKTSNG